MGRPAQPSVPSGGVVGQRGQLVGDETGDRPLGARPPLAPREPVVPAGELGEVQLGADELLVGAGLGEGLGEPGEAGRTDDAPAGPRRRAVAGADPVGRDREHEVLVGPHERGLGEVLPRPGELGPARRVHQEAGTLQGEHPGQLGVVVEVVADRDPDGTELGVEHREGVARGEAVGLERDAEVELAVGAHEAGRAPPGWPSCRSTDGSVLVALLEPVDHVDAVLVAAAATAWQAGPSASSAWSRCQAHGRCSRRAVDALAPRVQRQLREHDQIATLFAPRRRCRRASWPAWPPCPGPPPRS